jgi:uncharacterized damage-inducible protein DinB
MDRYLTEAFAQNAWATKRLLAFCRTLTPEQLSMAGPPIGSILATLNHLIRADGYYLPEAKIERPSWARVADEESVYVADLDVLELRAGESAGLWERYLADPLDPAQLVRLDQGTYECPVVIPVIQALHHGSVHREQVCAMLTTLGYEPPDIQPWGYADETGRSRWLTGTRSG